MFECFADLVARNLKGDVAFTMAKHVIDDLKVIHVDHDDGEYRFAGFDLEIELLELLIVGIEVLHAGEFVLIRHNANLLDVLL